MPTHRRRASVLGLTLALTLAPSLLSAPAGYTRQDDQGGGPPQDTPRGKAGGKDERHEAPDPCQQALKAEGEAKGLHGRCEGAGGGGGAAKGDFNGDGFADLAVGVPYEDQNGVNAVGGVNVIYGSENGLTSANDQFLDEMTFGYAYTSNDHFGWALASGDFNGDTYSDLAIGMPHRDGGRIVDSGRVLLIDGSENGLNTATARTLSLLPGGHGSAGEALVWADFNGDGFGDLAVGIPGATVAQIREFLGVCTPEREFKTAGEVQVFYGGGNGLTQLGAQRFHQGFNTNCHTNGVGSLLEDDARFGSSLAAGNFNADFSNGNPVSDLVIGVPYDDSFGADVGLLHILRGDVDGLRHSGVRTLNQDSFGVGGAAEAGDQFGRVLATGDFNGDLRDDLAVGVPFEDLIDNTRADGGAVHVFFGSPRSIEMFGPEMVTTEGSMFISQAALSGVSVEAGDRFGWSLAVGRFDDDGFDDLAVGAPGEAIGSIKRAGIAQVLYGSPSGPSLTRVQIWHQNTANVPDSAESGDQFGYALSAWDFGKGGRSDLAIGVPFEDLLSASTGTQQADAGAVILVYGTATGLSATAAIPAQLWHQDVSGINDVMQAGDRFGNALY